MSGKETPAYVAEVEIKKGDLLTPSSTEDGEVLATGVDPTGIALNDAAVGELVHVEETECCSKISEDVVRGQFVKPDPANPGKVKNAAVKDAECFGKYTKSVVFVDGNSEAPYMKLI